jgi:hypothetical protein
LKVIDVLLRKGHLYSPIQVVVLEAFIRHFLFLVFFLGLDWRVLNCIFSLPKDVMIFSKEGLGRRVAGELKIFNLGLSHFIDFLMKHYVF